MFIKNQRAESWKEGDDEEEFWNGDDDSVTAQVGAGAARPDSDSIQSWDSGPSEVEPDFSAVDLHKIFIKNQHAESRNGDDDEEEFWNGDDDSVTAQVGARATCECYADSDSIQSWDSGPSDVEPDFSAVNLHKMFRINNQREQDDADGSSDEPSDKYCWNE